MLGRRGVRRIRHFRDRGEPMVPLTPAHPPRYNSASSPGYLTPQQPPDDKIPTTFLWPDPNQIHTNVVLVASFDGHLHHKMRPIPSTPRSFQLTLRVPPGNHTFKFLADGVWSTHSSLHSKHPIQLTDEGVKHHCLVVYPPAPSAADIHRDRVRDTSHNTSPLVTMTRLQDPTPPATVFRSASASAVPSHQHLRADRTQSEGTAATPTSYSKTVPSVPLHEGSRRHGNVEMSPRGGSFNAPLPVGGISHMQAVNRKSLLQRVGAGWLRRFSSRPDDNQEPTCASSMSHSQFSSQDRSGTSMFRSKDRSSLFPSSSEPSVGRSDDKENACTPNKQYSLASSDRSRRVTVRGSQRSSAVKVSMPTKVDEPKDDNEVNRQADNWRQMARHLQENLFDPTGARELFSKAITHREKHGLFCTTNNAQVHVDLARNLSRAEKMKDAEFHLRTALTIYIQVEAGREHIADLMLYVGVVVDRQRRREEAEELYRKALKMYKDYRLAGNNVDIAVKNLSLNLRKQNREHDIEKVHREFFDWKKQAIANP